LKGIDPYIVSEADAGKTIQLKKGELMDVSLEGNLTTGFTWEVLVQDPVLVEQVGEPEYNPDSEKFGSPGNITLHFKAISTGQTTLKLGYHRPWEKDVEPERNFEFSLIVK